MKAHWGSEDIAPLIDLMEMNGHLHAPVALLPGKETLVPIG
jgi:hypothetical protein